jgi:hypothetical protein
MGDPIWLDTNTVQYAINGDAAINQQLATYRKADRPLLVPPAVANELLNGNVLTMKGSKAVWQQVPSPQLKTAMQTSMNKLGIQVDWSSNQVPMERRVEYYGIKSVNKVSDSDRLVLGQIKASAEARGVAKPQMITGEGATKPMITEASKWGIESVPTAKPSPGSVPAPPHIDLADYPPEKEGAISRFFKDRPVLKKFGLIGANITAQYISQQALSQVEEYFTSILNDAQKEFESKYPDPVQLKSRANLDRYKQAYEAALFKLKAPTREKVAEALILAFTRDRDIVKTKKYLDDQISKVKSAADGTISAYSKVALEYIDAMIAAYKQVLAAQELVEVSADIEKRGSVIESAGDALEETFWRVVPAAAAFPFAYYTWLDVYNVAKVLERVGESVLAFSSGIKDRYKSYLLIQKQLDEELTKVSNELASYEL